MRSGRTRRTLATAGVLLALSLTTGLSGAAVAEPLATARPAAVEEAAPQTLELKSSTDGLTAPTTAHPGPTTFRVSTTDPASGWISLVRPKPGVTFESFRASILKMINAVGPDIVEGSAEMRQKAELLGGTVIHPNLPASFTRTLTPGTYWFFDYRNIRAENPRHSVLTVGGTTGTGTAPAPAATLTGRMTDGQPRWNLDGTVRAGRPILFRNAMPDGQYIEAIFFRLAADVTEQDVRDYVADFGDTGQFPDYPGPLDLEQGTGGLPMDSGQSSLLELTLQPGRYVVVDFFSDAKDGSSLIKRGHWKIFEVK
ncbi:hypothetical protein [Streptomyces lanatus]|uniref:Uncharacterized protein n=1 Tax=Streptomyces lanatus TaxID=66900 RepID=A0ABV1Y676_9ACTN|nr:hypothetical protein [Streptomyces lanatus]GHH30535.1 hypothetical protein GCM10018780_90070 [Streptomyces lanatus]